MENNDIIKTIVPQECPHCKNPIIIEFTTMSPKVMSVYTIEEIKTAKNDAIKRIELLDIDIEKKNDIIKWIMDEETLFGKSEVDAIIKNVLTPEI